VGFLKLAHVYRNNVVFAAMGYLRDMTGNFAAGLYALAGFAALAAIVAAVCVRETPAKSSAAEPLAAAAG
jgi:hypothetical protein